MVPHNQGLVEYLAYQGVVGLKEESVLTALESYRHSLNARMEPQSQGKTVSCIYTRQTMGRKRLQLLKVLRTWKYSLYLHICLF